MEKLESIDHKKRQFVLGLGAASTLAVAGGFGYETVRRYQNYHRHDDFVHKSGDVKEETEEVYDELSNSGYFLYEVSLHDEQFKRDTEVALSRVDIIQKIQQEFSVPSISETALRQSIESLMPALAFVESRLDNGAESEELAFGVLQIMPSTWDDLAEEGEERASVTDQIKVAARLIEQSYRYISSTCREELTLIKQNYFDNDDEAFERCFFAPVLLNAYNAGMGTLTNLIKQFAAKFPDPASTVMLFEQSEQLTGFDVFIGMSHTAYQEEWVEWYKEHATAYTTKVYSAHGVLHDAFQKARDGGDA